MKKAAEAKMESKTISTNKSTIGGVPKNFRQQADIEAFYRFVYENDLRDDAVQILQETRTQKDAVKAAKNRVKH